MNTQIHRGADNILKSNPEPILGPRTNSQKERYNPNRLKTPQDLERIEAAQKKETGKQENGKPITNNQPSNQKKL